MEDFGSQPFRHRARRVIAAIRTGGLALRREEAAQPETATPEADHPEGPILPNYERFLPPSLFSLRENVERDPAYLAKSLVDTLIHVADAYDSMDHRTAANPAGSEVQDLALQVRNFARSLPLPEPPKEKPLRLVQ